MTWKYLLYKKIVCKWTLIYWNKWFSKKFNVKIYIYKIQILMVKAKQKATIKVDKTTSVNCKI